MFSERDSRGDGGVTAERDLGSRTEVAHPEPRGLAALGQEGGLGIPDNGRDLEHLVVCQAGGVQDDSGWIAALSVVGEG